MGVLKVLWLLAFALACQAQEQAYFRGCDHVYDLNFGLSYLESPYYPKSYPRNSSCRYKFKAPANSSITVQCTINMYKGGSSCTTERFYLARDGDLYLRGSEELCGSGTITRQSLFNTITLAYISRGATGTFKCSFNVKSRPCDCGWSVNTKIVSGEEASPNEFPSIVALRDRTSRMPLYCSADIISHRFIATAAHCAHFQPNAAYIEVLVGRQNIETSPDTRYAGVYYVSKIIVHPAYTPDPTHNDIALMKTTRDIEFNKGVGPICLPPLSNIYNDFSYNEVTVAGWGSKAFADSSSPTLQKVTLMTTTESSCRQFFKGQDQIFSSHICTYDYTGKRKDSCQYDSGGPVIFRHLSRQFLIGIISFGKHCGGDGYAMGVNERITSHLHWILANTEDSTCTTKM